MSSGSIYRLAPLSPNAWLFNPSILTFSGGIILCFRSWSYDGGPVSGVPSASNPTFMWANSWKTTATGHDNTRIGILGGKKSIVLRMVDTRIMKVRETDRGVSFLAIGNTFTEGRTWMSLERLYLNKKTGEIRVLGPNGGKPLCPNVSRSVEKNWALIEGTHLDLLYGLAPEVSEVRRRGRNCSREVFTGHDSFEDLEDYYRDIYGSDLKFAVSLSTPCLKWRGRYLSLGHIKYAYRTVLESKVPSRLKRFTQCAIRRPLHHHSLAYVMFWYSFRMDESGEPVDFRVSSAFLDDGSILCSSLNFASGLAFLGDNVLVSYGVDDAACAMLSIRSDAVASMLKKPTTPDAYRFGTLYGERIVYPEQGCIDCRHTRRSP